MYHELYTCHNTFILRKTGISCKLDPDPLLSAISTFEGPPTEDATNRAQRWIFDIGYIFC